MGYLPADDYLLYGYLDRGKLLKATQLRKLSSEEMAWINQLRKKRKDINVLVMELITINAVLRHMKEARLFYITQNLNRIISSLMKQRAFMDQLRYNIGTTVPTMEEIPLIRKFAQKIQTRIDYLHRSIIPENLRLTPIQEYLEIKSADDFVTDIYARFGNGINIYAANTGENDELDAYVTDILETVRAKGLYDRHQERLEAYIAVEERRLRKKKDDVAKAKNEQTLVLAKEGMEMFLRMFHDGIRTLTGCKRIRMSPEGVETRINQYGRGVYLILSTYVYQGKCVYRYISCGGSSVERFYTARIFKDKAEAANMMTELQKKHPNRIFEIVSMGDEEEHKKRARNTGINGG